MQFHGETDGLVDGEPLIAGIFIFISLVVGVFHGSIRI